MNKRPKALSVHLWNRLCKEKALGFGLGQGCPQKPLARDSPMAKGGVAMLDYQGKASITLAVSFDEQTESLLAIASSLCKRLNQRLHIVHVCESLWRDSLWALSEESALGERIAEMSAAELAAASARLAHLLSTLPSDIEATVRAEKGPIAERIVSAALRDGSSMIICGNVARGKRLPFSFSVPLALANAAPLPVLIVSDAASLGLCQEAAHCRLLLCDDLSAGTLPVVRFAYEFAQRLRQASLHHMHVQTISVSSLEGALGPLLSFMRDPLHPAYAYSEMIDKLNRELQERIRQRDFSAEVGLAESQGQVTREIVTGFAKEEIAEAARRLEADLLILGKHVGIHRKPFYIGQLPMSLMLALDRSVLIVGTGATH